MKQTVRKNIVVAIVMTMLVALAACGDDDEFAGPSPSTPSPTPTPTPTSTPTPRVIITPTPASGCVYEGDLQALIDCVKNESLELAGNSAAPQSNVTPDNPWGYSVQEYLTYIVTDLDKVWSQWFKDVGFAEPYVEFHIIMEDETAVQSKCFPGEYIPHNAPNAWYCPVDDIVVNGVADKGTILLPVTTFQQMWTGNIFGKESKVLGDFGAALITAHEFGHHVQDEIYQQIYRSGETQIQAPRNPYAELIADCFAGVWLASAYQSGLLETNDLEEGVAALEQIGDPPYVVSHGTAQQRLDALSAGYLGIPDVAPAGDPTTCIKLYWK